MENKIRINLGYNLELVAELSNYDGNHPEIEVFIEKDGLVHQDICLVRPHDEPQASGSVNCLVWSDPNNEDFTDNFIIDIYHEEQEDTKNDMALEDLLKMHDCDSVREMSEYINYLKDVQADYEHLKSKFKCLVDEVDSLY